MSTSEPRDATRHATALKSTIACAVRLLTAEGLVRASLWRPAILLKT